MEVLTGDFCVITGKEGTITGRGSHTMEDDAFGLVLPTFIRNHDNRKLLCIAGKGY